MLRLPSLDEHLAGLLRRMARGVLQDTVLLLLSDHGREAVTGQSSIASCLRPC